MQVAMLISENEASKIDYAKILKKIMASEPPFAAELESHIKFAKVWGEEEPNNSSPSTYAHPSSSATS